MKYTKFEVLTSDKLFWDFQGGNPYYQVSKTIEKYPHTIRVDPFPCSTVDPIIMEVEIERVEKMFPIGTLLKWVALPNEIEERTNAWARSEGIYIYNEMDDDYELKKKHKLEGIVVISGKRTIVHPAMASYLAAHEYGHQVDYWITKLMREKDGTLSENHFRKYYAHRRGIDYREGYGAGRWKGNTQEVIADDFRIIMCNTDLDFWEHPYPHPFEVAGLRAFWNELYEEYAFKNDINEDDTSK